MKKFYHYFFWSWTIVKAYFIYYIPVQIPYLKKILLGICTKILLANQAAGFVNLLYLKNDKEIALIFSVLIQIHANLKLIQKVLGGRGQKRVWAILVQGSKIECISLRNWQSKLIFSILLQIQKKLKVTTTIHGWE